MFDLIKKTMLTGIGLAAMTKDKVEGLAKELIEKGELSEKEGKKLVDEMLKKSEQAGKDMEAKIEGVVQKAIGKMDLASKKDVSQLAAKIKRLEKKTTSEQE